MGNSLRGYLGNLCGTEESKRAFAESCEERQPQPKPASLQDEDAKETETSSDVKENPSASPLDEDEAVKEDDKLLEATPAVEKDANKPEKEITRSSSQKKTVITSVLNFSAPKFESFGIGELDQKFESAYTILNSFVESLLQFKTAMTLFMNAYKKKEFEQALSAHKEAVKGVVENKQAEEEGAALLESGQASDPSDRLKFSRDQYKDVIVASISNTQEKLDSVITDISNINIKDYVRDEMADKSFISKFSVPGKYRRNLKVLKKKRKVLDEIDSDLKDWYKLTTPVDGSESQTVKPDLLGNVTELKQSPGAARRVQPQEEATTDVTAISEVRSDDEVGLPVIDSTDSKAGDEGAISEILEVMGQVGGQVDVVAQNSHGDKDEEHTVAEDLPHVEGSVHVEEKVENQPRVEEPTRVEEEVHVDARPHVDEEVHVKEQPLVEAQAPVEESTNSEEPIHAEPEKQPNVKIEVTPSSNEEAADEHIDGGQTAPAVTEKEKPEPLVNGEVVTEVAVADGQASPTTDRLSKAEEKDEVGILPEVPIPSSSKLERKVSSNSADFEEGKLVDYGSYLILNDDQDLMRRSRSLDSLTSRGSRPSMSRLGSYEIVTNFEVKVAEQAEAEKIRTLGTEDNSL